VEEKELAHEVELVEIHTYKNQKVEDFLSLIARGVWQVALQLAKLNTKLARN
jgi:hypothetical protein